MAPAVTMPGSSPSDRPQIRLNSALDDLTEPDTPSQSRSLTHNTQRSNPYYTDNVSESQNRLLPPPRNAPARQHSDSPQRSPALSAASSRRSSWESQDSRGFDNPFADSHSRSISRAGSDSEDVNTQTVSEKYNILPSAGLLLFPEDIEKDDDLHNPDKEEARDCDIFTRRGFVNVGGLSLITIGLLFLFIGYPAM